jgi:hypothetical protein
VENPFKFNPPQCEHAWNILWIADQESPEASEASEEEAASKTPEILIID